MTTYNNDQLSSMYSRISLSAPWVPLLLTVSVAVLLAHEAYVFAPCDDAYIFLVYVKNLLSGNGLTYNGDYVQGFSSIAWPWLLAILGLIQIPLPATLAVASTLSAIATLIASYWASRKIGIPQKIAVLPPILLACSSDFAFYASNGLETVFFSLLFLIACVLAFEDRGENTLTKKSTTIVIFLLPLVRPEGALVAAIIVSWIAMTQRDGSGLLKISLKLALAWAPILLLLRYFYGHWLPATYYAKSGAGLANLQLGIEYTRLFFIYYWPIFVTLIIGVLANYKSLPLPILPIIALMTLWFLQITIQGGDNMVGFRVYLPILPTLYILIAYLFRNANISIAALATFAACTYLFTSYNFGTIVAGTWGQSVKQQAAGWTAAYKERYQTGLWMQENLPKKALTALNPAGITPYYSELPTIDMLGLNNIDLALHGKRDRTIPYGHQVGDGAYVLSKRPAVIWFSGIGPNPGPFISDREIWQTPAFHENYSPCQITDKTWLWIDKQIMRGIQNHHLCSPPQG